jgi:hypothetical protein
MTDLEIIKKYNLEKYIPRWESSYFQERVIRFGIESQKYNERHCGDKFDIHLADCQNLIRQSFVCDMIQFIKNNSHLSDEQLRRWISTRYA